MEGIRLQEACNTLRRAKGQDLVSAYDVWTDIVGVLSGALDECGDRVEEARADVAEKKAAEEKAVFDHKLRLSGVEPDEYYARLEAEAAARAALADNPTPPPPLTETPPPV